MTAPVAQLPADPEQQQPTQDHQAAETVATIAALLAAAGSVGATYGAAETARAGIVHALGKLGLKRRQAADLVAQDAATPPPPRIPVSAAARRVGGDGPTYRALYLVNAAKRLTKAVKSPDLTVGDQLAKERRYFQQHKTAQTEREQAAQRIDAATNSYGPILGWYARLDERTTPECRAANRRNFRPDQPPAIGLPGLKHSGRCRCWPGPPIPGANQVDDLGPAHEHANTGEGIELASADGHHIPGTPYTYRHGWHKIAPTGDAAKLKEAAARLGPKSRAAALHAEATRHAKAAPVVKSYASALAAITSAKDRKATVGKLSTAELRATDAEFTRRATALGKAGKVSSAHKAVKDELARRSSGGVHLAHGGEAVELSAKTGYYATHHHELGTPGGPGLWRHKGWQLPDYIGNIAKGIMESGVTDKSRAIAIAVGKVRDWSEGRGKVSPEVRAASAKAIAEWDAKRAATKNHSHAAESRGSVELASADGHHIAGTPDTYRHGWIKIGFREPTADDHTRLHAAKITVPPAWTHVQVAHDPNAPLQVIGRDSKGREQRIYSAEHHATQAAAKFARISALSQALPAIDRAISADAHHDDSAAALMLIRRMGLRPGSEADTGAEKKAHGATNLRVRHVQLSPDGDVRLTFTGKKGVALDLKVHDREMAATLSSRMVGKSPDDRLFATNERKVGDYLHSTAPGFKVKDLRTWMGTDVARRAVAALPTPNTSREYRSARATVGKQVSDVLGNTPTVALASYVDPTVFGPWDQHLAAGKAT